MLINLIAKQRNLWNFLPAIVLPAALVFILTLVIANNQSVYQHLQQQILRNYIDSEKQRIRSHVDNAVEIIVNRQTELQNQLRQRLKYRADSIQGLLSQLLVDMPTSQNAQQKSWLIEAIRSGQANSGSEEVWLIDQSGKLLMAPDYYSNLEGESILGFSDTMGKPYIEDELKFLERNTQGFLTSSIEQKSNDLKKFDTRLSYVRRLPVSGWYVAVRANIKAGINREYRGLLQVFQQTGMHSSDYFFIFDKQGNILMNTVRNDLVGKNLYTGDDETVQRVYEKLMSVSRRSPSDEFVGYQWLNPDSGRMDYKLAYVQPIPNLDWVIGKGFYPKSLNPQFQLQQQRLQQEYQIQSDYLASLRWLAGFIAFVVGLLIAYLQILSQRACLQEQLADNGELKKQAIMLENQLLVKQEMLNRLQTDLDNHSMIDPQTQIASRSVLLMRLRDEAQRCQRLNQPFSCLLFSVDRWSELQAKHNQVWMDSLLQELTTLVFNQIRAIDVFGRFDEQRFMIILPHTEYDELSTTAERLQRMVEVSDFVDGAVISISIGGAQFVANQQVTEFISHLEKALQKAKDIGDSERYIHR